MYSNITGNVLLIVLFLTIVQGFQNQRPHFLILPGFGNDAIDYINPLTRGLEFGFVNTLRTRGFEVDVVPIKRTDWLKILGAIISKDFWTSTCKPSLLFDFYFKAVDGSIREINIKKNQPVVLIGHSAGGWLARGIVGNGTWASSTTPSSDLVAGLVTLGAPHLPPLIDAPDMTRGALRYVDASFPGAYLCTKTQDSLFYITVAGTAVQGDRNGPKGSIGRFASGSYGQVTGDINGDEVVGDGVVPLSHAHLEGAEQITLDGCFHSIQSDKWYGGDSVVDSWLPQTLLAYSQTMKQRQQLQEVVGGVTDN